MASRSRRLNPGEEGLWPNDSESRDWLEDRAALAEQARANMASKDRKSALLEVAGLPYRLPDVDQTPAVVDPLPPEGLSEDVVSRARELSKHPEVTARESVIRNRVRIEEQERQRIKEERQEAYAEEQFDFDEASPRRSRCILDVTE